jgi:hypothetical protein
MTSSKRHKMLAPEILDEAAIEIFDIIDEEGIRAALIGGRALQLYGSDRLTGDIDLAVTELPENLEEEKQLSFGGFQTHASNGTPVDIVARSDDFDALYDKAVEGSVYLDDYEVPVATLEFLAAIKFAATRDRDKFDFDWIVTESNVDLVEARKIVREYLGPYAAQEFDIEVAEAQWKKSQGRR